jgi:hypothetical protein
MAQGSLADDLAGALHQDPIIRSRVGGRIMHSAHLNRDALPNIVVSTATRPARPPASGNEVIVTCRAETSAEADRVGAAVVKALSGQRSSSERRRWVKIQDRSGYDSTSKSFRRTISVQSQTDSSK